MHKKDQVKQVIEQYIQKGRDFFELTPSFLENTTELKGFSERTLKRGRTEYKLEHPEIIKTHSRSTASAKKRVLKYLDKSPQASPKELGAIFPDVEKKVLSTARDLWKNEHTSEMNKKTAGSLRKSVFGFLEKNPQATPNNVTSAFAGHNPKTVANYHDQWLKEHGPKKKVSLKQRILDYMNENPGADLKQLREAFADTKTASINTYFSLWKNNRMQPIEPRQETNNHTTLEGDSDIIQALKTTIEAQQKTIEVLKSQNEILKDRQSTSFPELEGMTADEVKTVERVIRTFIKGIKNI